MAKKSGRHLSKKILPLGMKRITENGKRVWKIGDLRFNSLKDFYLKLPIQNDKSEEVI